MRRAPYLISDTRKAAKKDWTRLSEADQTAWYSMIDLIRAGYQRKTLPLRERAIIWAPRMMLDDA